MATKSKIDRTVQHYTLRQTRKERMLACWAELRDFVNCGGSAHSMGPDEVTLKALEDLYFDISTLPDSLRNKGRVKKC